ncbi:MAG: hypothetical protein AAF512_00800 [Pseudomonadota bacterium]
MDTDTSPPVAPEDSSAPVNTVAEKTDYLQGEPADHVKDAQLLLAYASQQGLEIKREVIEVVVGARHALENGAWDVKTETDFWLAFNTLAKIVAPASVDSLQATHAFRAEQTQTVTGLKSWFSWLPGLSSHHSPAHRRVSRYQRFGLLVLGLLVFVQAYWVIGIKITQAIQDTTQ